ncbi:MAG: SIS domain-containing protein [Chloroflexi bacterium]|nr:SIS domain-containing protein [Chloroflexota bacterium]
MTHTQPSTEAEFTHWLAELKQARPAVAAQWDTLQSQPAMRGLALALAQAYEAITTALAQGGTLYLCGNGGSYCDALHISGELLKAFVLPRPVPADLAERLCAQPDGAELAQHLQTGLRAHVLGANTALASAVANDIPMPGIGYAQELYALARPGDVFLGISTSGKARNVRLAAQVAGALGLTTIGLTGRAPNPLADMCDIALAVPERETYRVQELHLTLYHQLCLMVEARFFG